MFTPKGVIPALVTPLDSDGELMEDALRNVIDFTIAGGVHGIFILGSGGEIYGLDDAQKRRVVEISAERSGVGGALVQAVIKLGPAFGASILGSVLNDTYQSHVSVAGLPASAATAVHQSVFKALAVAAQVGSPALADSARAAFVAGMDDATRVAAAIAVAAMVGAVLLLPRRSRAADSADSADSATSGTSGTEAAPLKEAAAIGG